MWSKPQRISTASSSTKAGSKAASPGWPMPISGVSIDLVRAAFGRQRHARRRRHQHEARILVAGVVQRIEAAGDERIVERADRQQPRAEERRRRARARRAAGTGCSRRCRARCAGRAATCASAAPRRPSRRGRRRRARVRPNRPRRLTQPPRLVETVTSGEVVTMRRASSLSPPARSFRIAAEALLRRHARAVAAAAASPGTRDRRRRHAPARPRALNGTAARKRSQLVGRHGAGRRTAPTPAPSATAMALLEASPSARAFIRPEWLSLWPAKGRP